jgi:hypothetical protein
LFCHPAEWHDFAKPARHEGEIIAGNGYLCLRAHRGGWIDHEIPPALPDFLERIRKIPWSRFDSIKDASWRSLGDVRAQLFDRAPIAPWNGHRMAPTPIWLVDEIPVRLSLLQLISRLPRCEVATGLTNSCDPLFFRFSGGRGAIARDPKLCLASFQIFAPQRDIFTGDRQERRQGSVMRLTQPGVNWPPPDCAD